MNAYIINIYTLKLSLIVSETLKLSNRNLKLNFDSVKFKHNDYGTVEIQNNYVAILQYYIVN